MIRLFTKNSTGVAPDGRWFAGDVNALQDAVAAVLDYTQTIGTGALAIGEVGLQLLRFGAGEARLTGNMRIDGILRGLAGLVAGSYTTTARDAIALGSRPPTMIVYNTTTARFEYNAGSDATPNWLPLFDPTMLVNVLGYAEYTGGLITITQTVQSLATTLFTGPAVTVDGTTPVLVSAFIPFVRPNGSVFAAIDFSLWDGSTDLGLIGQYGNDVANNNDVKSIFMPRRITPTAGSHTFSVRGRVSSSAGQISAGPGGSGSLVPAYIKIARDI